MILSTAPDATPTPPGPAAGAPAAPTPPAAPAPDPAGTPAPAPAAAPAEAKPDPVTLAEPEAKPTPDPDTSAEFTYDPSGDASLDIALGFIGKLGYSNAHPAVQAAMAGDWSVIKAELAVKGVQGGAEMLEIAQQGSKRLIEAAATRDKETREYAEKLCQGAENFKAVTTWAKANLPQADKDWFNASVSQGGIAAQAAIDKLTQSYLSANKFDKTPANPVSGNAASATPGFGDSGPITRAQYTEGLAALRQAAGGRDIMGSDQLKALEARRVAGMRAGLN